MTVQRYSVLERLDAGGMAEVFKGKATSVQGIEKLVAIKRILPSLTKNEKFVSMFLDEARLAMHLNHANIVHVFDLGVADGTYFLVMEYIEGTNLKILIDHFRNIGRRLPLPVSLYLMSQVCEALGYAHEKTDLDGNDLGIVHRDVSPPNILLSNNGEVKLADFGLAKAQSQVESTDPGIVKGKFSYLSPESAYGETVDARSDVFSVGILLWELVAGRRLFLGDTDLQTLELVRKCRVPGLEGKHPEVGEELAGIIERALARDVMGRWQGARELGQELIRFLFSKGLKVSAPDVAALVREVVGDSPRAASVEPDHAPVSFIDRLIVGELEHFRSISSTGALQVALREDYDGSRPLSLDETGAVMTQVGMEEPRDWALDTSTVPKAAAPTDPTAARAEGRVRDTRVAVPVSEGQAPAGRRGKGPATAGPAKIPLSAVPLWLVLVIAAAVMVLSSVGTYLAIVLSKP